MGREAKVFYTCLSELISTNIIIPFLKQWLGEPGWVKLKMRFSFLTTI